MFLDTANGKEIEAMQAFHWLTGVTTNPTLLAKENGKSRADISREILSILHDEQRLFVQATGETQEALYDDAQTILSLDTRIALKIPADEIGFRVITQLKQERPDIEILATAIFSVEQSYLAALAGCEWVAPYVNRMANQGLDAKQVVASTAQLFKQLEAPTKILGASFKNTAQVTDTLLAGATDVTIPSDLVQAIMQNKLAADSIRVFNQDAKGGKR
ncbi:transaldolase family protein [Listeria booriae]|uniref:transaldolase family protein n=1 Tax=Listeria booriae TaxID=1552123 RepID=UPI0016281736|nr:transaldolase family protein [Listeria booriae]MBC2324944.1 transaldolase [Listeria booriae]MCD2208302.1 transaldolase [Listeria booriae]